MKRLTLGASCVLVAGVALAGCSSTVTPPGSTGASSGSTIRLSAVASDKEAIEGTIAAFEKANPGVKVQATFADVDPYQSTLRTQLSSGTAPDVFFAWPGNGNAGAVEVLAPGGYMEDLSNRPWAAKIPEGLKQVTQVDGKTWITPTTFTGIGVIYNKKTLADVGGEVPTTWTGVLELCDAAKAKGKVAFALGNQTPWVTQLVDYALVATTVYANSPNFDADMAAGKATFAGSGWKTAMEKYLEMNKRGCFSKDPLGTSFESAVAQVGKGEAVGVVQVTAVATQIKEASPAGAELAMFALPATDNPDETRMPGAAGGAYAVNAKSPNKELALKFVDFLAEPANMNAYATVANAAPAIPNDSFTPDAAFQTLIDHQQAGKTATFMDQLWPNPKVQQVHLTGVQDLFSGKATPDEVLAEMDETYKSG